MRFLCVCACVCAHARVCVCACVVKPIRLLLMYVYYFGMRVYVCMFSCCGVWLFDRMPIYLRDSLCSYSFVLLSVCSCLHVLTSIMIIYFAFIAMRVRACS